jgi:hypothetical protein
MNTMNHHDDSAGLLLGNPPLPEDLMPAGIRGHFSFVDHFSALLCLAASDLSFI